MKAGHRFPKRTLHLCMHMLVFAAITTLSSASLVSRKNISEKDIVVSGVVLDSTDRHPLCLMEVFLANGNHGIAATKTDWGGRFSLSIPQRFLKSSRLRIACTTTYKMYRHGPTVTCGAEILAPKVETKDLEILVGGCLGYLDCI
jgi:hypothetical protein